MVKGDAATLLWYDFPNVFWFFAGFWPDSTGSVSVRIRLYVLRAGMRDLVDGVTFPAGTPTSPGPPTTWFRRAF